MKTSSLQSIIKANSESISYHEAVIQLLKSRIFSCKYSNSFTLEADLKKLRNKLSREKGKLKRLAEVQRELKRDVAGNVDEQRFWLEEQKNWERSLG